MGSGGYRDEVEASVSESTTYEVLWVTTEATGLFGGIENIVVAVEFPARPTDDELKALFADVAAPFPAGSDDFVTITVSVAGGAGVSLEDQVGEWFPPGAASPGRVTVKVSELRDAIESH